MILLTPGPCMTSPSVRAASAVADINHRESAYRDLIHETRERLLGIVDGTSGWSPYLLGGSGTAAVEAMVSSCVVSGPVLILANGYYSDRIDAIFAIHGIPHRTLRFDWMEAWDLGVVEAAMAVERYEATFVVHHETTSGRLNDLGGLAELAARYGVRVLVDAMSSFGGDSIPVEGVSAIAASSNKCLHGLPGVSFVLVAPELELALDAAPRRTYYLSLPMYRGENPPLTPPIPMLSALRQALREYTPERRAIYRARSTELRRGLAELGLAMPIPEPARSQTLTMATLPDGWDWPRWFAANESRGYILYGCKGDLADRYFQLSVMGELPLDAIGRWLEIARELV